MRGNTVWKNEGDGLLSRDNAKGSKSWAIRVSIKNKKHFESFGEGPRGKAKALARLAEIQEARATRTTIPTTYADETLGKLAQEALTVLQAELKNEKDRKTMALRVKRICDKHGHLRLSEITSNHLEHFRVFLLNVGYKNRKGITKPLSRTTIEQYSDIFSNILDYAVRGKKLKENPVKGWKRYSKPPAEETRSPLNGEDWDLFKGSLPEGWFRDAIIALRYSGLRLNELVQLDWSRIDLDKKVMVVRGSLRLKQSVKRKSSNRMVPIHPEVEAILRRNLKRKTEYPFPGPNGRIKPSTPENMWRNLRERLAHVAANDEDKERMLSYRIHDLRHGFAVESVERGLPLTALQRILGHARLEETAKYAAFNDSQTLGAFWNSWGHDAK
jgi:integrase